MQISGNYNSYNAFWTKQTGTKQVPDKSHESVPQKFGGYSQKIENSFSNNMNMLRNLFGVRSNAALDTLMKNGKSSDSLNAPDLEGKIRIPVGDNSWKKIVSVSDEVRDKIIETVREQYIRNGDGMGREQDSDEMTAINNAYLKNIPPNERLSVAWTLDSIYISEAQRIVNYIQSQDPTWEPGKPFDRSILTDSEFGTADMRSQAEQQQAQI